MKKASKLKAIFTILVVAICLIGFSMEAVAQKKKTPVKRTTKPKAPAATTVKTTAPVVTNTAEIRNGAEKVSIQIKNVSKFVYLLGGVAKGIEDIDKEARTGRVKREVLDQNAQFKQNVIQSIRNLRAGIAALETEFRTNSALRTYIFQIDGVSDLVGSAENQAANGQFTEAGKTLLLVIEKLSDTLVALP